MGFPSISSSPQPGVDWKTMTESISLNDIGMIVAFSTAFLLIHRFRSLRHAVPLPKQAYVGAGIIFIAHVFTQFGVAPVAIFFTPIAWTGYILWIDGAIYSLRGKSILRNHPSEFAWIAISSIPLWLIFEIYNLRLQNWIYIGLPSNWWIRQIGYMWSFATIWPGIFETAALLRALEWNVAPRTARSEPAKTVPTAWGIASLTIGFLMVSVPVMVSTQLGAYLFGPVWLGFIFLLEPINQWTGRVSLWGDLRRGDWSRLCALLWAGMICGVWWEFWNWFAAAKWFYQVPILPEWKVFAMPLPGYLGFPAFAVECFVLFAFFAPWLNWLSQKLVRAEGFRWRILEL